jgi:hypothetical protein
MRGFTLTPCFRRNYHFLFTPFDLRPLFQARNYGKTRAGCLLKNYAFKTLCRPVLKTLFHVAGKNTLLKSALLWDITQHVVIIPC